MRTRLCMIVGLVFAGGCVSPSFQQGLETEASRKDLSGRGFPETTAEETFKKIAEAIEKADTVTVRFKALRQGSGEHELQGTILIKKRNKLNCTFRWSEEEEHRLGFMISDGSQMAWKGPEGSPRVERSDTPEHIGDDFVFVFIAVGLFVAGEEITPMGYPGPRLDPRAILKLSDFKAGEDDRDAKTLTYTVMNTHRKETAHIKLWYNPKTCTMLKRVVSPTQRWLSETYEEITLNSDIPDEKFRLPEEKK